MKQLEVIIWLMVLLLPALATSQLPPPQPDCPIRVMSLWIKGGPGYGYQRPHVELKFQNNSDRTIKAVEFQFDTYDAERRVFLSRYFLTAACCNDAGFPGKPAGPGETKTLWGGVSSRLGILYGGYLADTEGLRRTTINVIQFTDGTKWERKGWRDEPNPNG